MVARHACVRSYSVKSSLNFSSAVLISSHRCFVRDSRAFWALRSATTTVKFFPPDNHGSLTLISKPAQLKDEFLFLRSRVHAPSGSLLTAERSRTNSSRPSQIAYLK